MSFGGFFGGSGSSSPSSSSPSPSPPSILNTTPTSSSALKDRLIRAIATEANVANAKQIISQVTTTCFQQCVPNPGSSLSGKEQACLSNCMEKYIEGFNAVHRTYVGRLQREGVSGGAMGGGSMGGQAVGEKELF